VFWFFFFVNLGGDFRGYVLEDPRGIASGILGTAIWAGPLWLYRRFIRTTWMTVLGGLVLLSATTTLLVVLFRSHGSTVGIGVLTLGLLLYAGFVVIGVADWLLARRK
jgi:drug/metabolite transporter (DMT)-like permease